MTPRREYVLAVISAVFAGIGTLVAVLTLEPVNRLLGGDDPPGRLELVKTVVRNGHAEYRGEDDGQTRQTRASMPTIDITLLNTGGSRVLLKEARIEIEEYADVFDCGPRGGGGDMPVTGRYGVALPLTPLPDERTLVTPLHQQLGPDEGDRFVLAFRPPENRYAAEWRFYVVSITLVSTAEEETLDGGRYLLAAPGSLPPNRVLPGDASALDTYTGRLPLDATWCFRRNLDIVDRLFAGDLEMASDVAVLGRIEPVSTWRRSADPTPPAQAARELAHGLRMQPVLAVFAAEQAGDPGLVAEIRFAAARTLLRYAREFVASENYGAAITDARASLDARDTPAARRVLAEAERLNGTAR